MITKRFLIFLSVRLFFSISIFYIYPIYSSKSFDFPDLNVYLGSIGESVPFYKMPNPLFSGFARLINYSPELIIKPNFIILSLIFNISSSSIYIYIATKILSYKNSIYYAILLGAHPYLAFYSLKIDTSLFTLFPISLILISVFFKKWINLKLLFISISSLFRNSILPLGWILSFKELKNFKNPLPSLGLVILSISSIINLEYAYNYLTQNYGCYSFLNISNWLRNLNLGNNFSDFLSVLITPITHLALNLSAREAISYYCLNIPSDSAGVLWIHYASTLFFLIFHSLLIYKLIRFVFINSKFDKNFLELLLPLTILLPTLYGSAHMRNLIPLIPMLILFLFKIETSSLRKNN